MPRALRNATPEGIQSFFPTKSGRVVPSGAAQKAWPAVIASLEKRFANR
jgi:hypothetical protein